jgi:hypothetical protein
MNFKITINVFHFCERKATHNSGSYFILKHRPLHETNKSHKQLENIYKYLKYQGRYFTARYVTLLTEKNQ